MTSSRFCLLFGLVVMVGWHCPIQGRTTADGAAWTPDFTDEVGGNDTSLDNDSFVEETDARTTIPTDKSIVTMSEKMVSTTEAMANDNVKDSLFADQPKVTSPEEDPSDMSTRQTSEEPLPLTTPISDTFSTLETNADNETATNNTFPQSTSPAIQDPMTQLSARMDALNASIPIICSRSLARMEQSAAFIHQRMVTTYRDTLARINRAETLLTNAQQLIREMTASIHSTRSEMARMSQRISLCETQLGNVNLQRELYECRRTSLKEGLVTKVDYLDIFSKQQSTETSSIRKKLDYVSKILNDNNAITNGLATGMRSLLRTQTSAEIMVKSVKKLTRYLPRDCSDISGAPEAPISGHVIRPPTSLLPIDVVCFFPSPLSSGWTIFQQRHNGSVDFHRSWEEYAEGFGTLQDSMELLEAPILSTEFWLGNNNLHRLTSQTNRPMSLRVELWTTEIPSKFIWAQYDNFFVASSDDSFRLRLSGYKGNATDALSHANGFIFTAGESPGGGADSQCAQETESGWWNQCLFTSLNGVFGKAIWWLNTTSGNYITLQRTRLMLRPKSVTDSQFEPSTIDQFGPWTSSQTETTLEPTLTTLKPERSTQPTTSDNSPLTSTIDIINETDNQVESNSSPPPLSFDKELKNEVFNDGGISTNDKLPTESSDEVEVKDTSPDKPREALTSPDKPREEEDWGTQVMNGTHTDSPLSLLPLNGTEIEEEDERIEY